MVPPLTTPTGPIANAFRMPAAPEGQSLRMAPPKVSQMDAPLGTLVNAFRGVGQFVNTIA